jgi:hypothetical protein
MAPINAYRAVFIGLTASEAYRGTVSPCILRQEPGGERLANVTYARALPSCCTSSSPMPSCSAVATSPSSRPARPATKGLPVRYRRADLAVRTLAGYADTSEECARNRAHKQRRRYALPATQCHSVRVVAQARPPTETRRAVEERSQTADDKRGGFWSTVPGAITGVALLLAIAVVGP